jgi:hypothetical protein
MESFARMTAALYRVQARTCRDMAEGAATSDVRALLLKVARHWEALADILDRYGSKSDGG